MTVREPDSGGRPLLSRREVLVGGAALGITVAGGGAVLAGGAAYAADAYTALRDRWRDIITGRPYLDPTRPEFQNALASLDSNVDTYLSRIDRTTGRTRVFTDLALNQTTDSALVTGTFTRLRAMAVAWFTPGSRHQGSAGVLADVLAGLDTANRVVYNASRAEFDNWWDWEIGSSRPLADCLLLLDEQLDATTRERYADAIRHFVPDPWYLQIANPKLSTGANRVDLCQAALVQGIASRSSARITRAADGLPVTCAYVQSGDGLYGDGSFIQHTTVAYTGTYGLVLLSGLAKLVELLSGSTWALTDPVMQNLYGAVEQAWAPVIHDGRMMSFVNGRAISRSSSPEQRLAADAIAAILQLARAGVVDAATAQRWRGTCRGWIDRATGYSPYSGADVPRTALVSALLRDAGVTPAPEPRSSVVFRNMGRSVHRRAGWAFAVSMCSNRIARYESMNGENLKGFHTGAGMTYLYDDDNAQYSDAFWPTVNPYRLPGTTVDRRPMADGAGETPLPTSRWAGGPVLGAYSAPGMTLQAATTNLVGKKSWFCFDEYIFAMGTTITGGSGYAVDTIVENRNLHAAGDNKLIVNGVEWVSGQNTTRTWTDAQWAHIEGVAGYLFPSATLPVLRADRTERTGTWRAINTGGSTTSITRRYLGLTIEHGTNPSNAAYMYLMIPKATVERTAFLADHRNVTIVSYNPQCHAVRQAETGITMANFWDAPQTRGGISVDKVCGVIVQELGDKLTVGVAEPIRTGTTIRVTVTPTLTGYRLVRNDPQVAVVSVGTSIVLDVTTGTFGRTFYAEFTRTA